MNLKLMLKMKKAFQVPHWRNTENSDWSVPHWRNTWSMLSQKITFCAWMYFVSCPLLGTCVKTGSKCVLRRKTSKTKTTNQQLWTCLPACNSLHLFLLSSGVMSQYPPQNMYTSKMNITHIATVWTAIAASVTTWAPTLSQFHRAQHKLIYCLDGRYIHVSCCHSSPGCRSGHNGC